MCIPRCIVTQRKTTFAQFWVIYPGLGSTDLSTVCTNIRSVLITCTERERTHAVHLCLPVNKELLCYKDTQKMGVTGNVGINKFSNSTAANAPEVLHICQLVSFYHDKCY
jgi:hypothetical protein